MCKEIVLVDMVNSKLERYGPLIRNKILCIVYLDFMMISSLGLNCLNHMGFNITTYNHSTDCNGMIT